MLKRFFKPKWQHANPDIRAAAVKTLPAEAHTVLKQLAINDEVSTVRQAAIASLSDIGQLIDCITATSHKEDRPFFVRRIAHCLDTIKASPPLPKKLLADLDSSGLLQDVFNQSHNALFHDQVVATATTPETCLALLTLTKTHKQREQLTDLLQTEEHLRAALDCCKQKDKSLTRKLKQRLQEKQARIKAKNTEQKKAADLLVKFEKLLKGTSTLPLDAELRAIQSTCSTLDKSLLPEETLKAIEEKLSELTTRVSQQQKEKTLVAEARELKKEQQLNLQSQQQRYNDLLQQLMATDSESLETLNQRIQSLTASVAPDSPLGKQCRALGQMADSLLAPANLLSKHPAADIPALPLPRAEAQLKDARNIAVDENIRDTRIAMQLTAYKQSLLKHIDTLHKDSKAFLKSLAPLIESLESALEAKQLQSSKSILQKIRQQVKKLAPQEKQSCQGTLTRLENRVKELADWHLFSTEPVRQQLVNDMRSLAENPLAAHEQAAAIRTLQSQWKSLGTNPDQALWETFQSLAKTAYEPCQQSFEEDRQKRQFNAEQRTRICEETEAFLTDMDWVNADYRMLDRLLKNILNEWKRFSPVERRDHEALKNRFDQSIDQLKSRILAHKKANLARYEALIAEAELLLANATTENTAELFKTLMAQWKTVGLTFHKEQDTRWKAFKAVGDALYERRRSERSEQKTAHQGILDQLKNAISQLNDITASLEQIADQNPDNLKAQVKELTAFFHQEHDLPETHLESVHTQWSKALARYQASLITFGEQQKFRSLKVFEDYLGNINASDTEPFNPEWIPSSMKPEWKAHFKGVPLRQLDPSSQEDHARKLCIEMEMLCQAETPEEDKALRMQLQMQALQNNFGREKDAFAFEKVESLYLAWFTQPPAFLKGSPQLTERFIKAVESVKRDSN